MLKRAKHVRLKLLYVTSESRPDPQAKADRVQDLTLEVKTVFKLIFRIAEQNILFDFGGILDPDLV